MSEQEIKPVAFAAFADNGNIQIWCADPIQAQTLREKFGHDLKTLIVLPDNHRIVPVEIAERAWADANVKVPPEVKGRVMSEMFWRGVYACQQAIIDKEPT